MNHSVSAFTPKSKTYSKTESLETRVTIAASVQILGYEGFWEAIYQDFGVTVDANLRKYLRNMDKKKEGKANQRKQSKGNQRGVVNGR